MKKKIIWYNTIEPEIRSIVKKLRNNGFNTTSSCGHDMWVRITIRNVSEIESIVSFLFSNKYSFSITDSQLNIFEYHSNMYKAFSITGFITISFKNI